MFYLFVFQYLWHINQYVFTIKIKYYFSINFITINNITFRP